MDSAAENCIPVLLCSLTPVIYANNWQHRWLSHSSCPAFLAGVCLDLAGIAPMISACGIMEKPLEHPDSIKNHQTVAYSR
jgi:hypothetical protein